MDDWPLLIVPGLTPMTGGVTPPPTATVTETAFETTVEGLLSVTWSSKFQTPVVERAPVDTEGVEEVVQVNEEPRLL